MATAATAPISYLIACCAIYKGGWEVLVGVSVSEWSQSNQQPGTAHFDWPTDKGHSLSLSLSGRVGNQLLHMLPLTGSHHNDHKMLDLPKEQKAGWGGGCVLRSLVISAFAGDRNDGIIAHPLCVHTL